MNTMMAFFLFQWFEAILGKLVIIPYQIGLFDISEYRREQYVSWWSADSHEMIEVDDGVDHFLPLLIAGFLVWHYAYSMIFGILNLGVERIFASFLLNDYENTPRAYIPATLLFVTHTVTGPFSFLVLTNRTGFYVATSPCFLNSILTFMFVVVWKVNEARRQKLEHAGPGSDYTLAQQFQVKENLRALRLARNLLIVVLCAMSVPCALLIMLVIGLASSFKVFIAQVIENSIYLNPIIICSVLMFGDADWRGEYLSFIPGLKRLNNTVHVFVVRPRPSSRAAQTGASSANNEGLVYFEQLKRSWGE
ncbi:unnamed protein product [Caenorhabditis sp. 36 PRJEB53466]|nr:unnamed protein product [Caenorhabditis sp. 36 PRJEB53466]